MLNKLKTQTKKREIGKCNRNCRSEITDENEEKIGMRKLFMNYTLTLLLTPSLSLIREALFSQKEHGNTFKDLQRT